MTRPAILRLVFALALMHLLADSAFAGGAVLCVGADDHRAVEAEHVPCELPETTDATASTYAASSSRGPCVDSPLHAEAEFAASADRTTQHGGGGPLARADATPQIRPVAGALRVSRTADVPATLRSHRHTVLQI